MTTYSANPCDTAADALPLRNWVTTFYNHPAQFIYNGKASRQIRHGSYPLTLSFQVYFSTFIGSDCTFGHADALTGWTDEFKSQLTGAQSVYFVPFFSVDPSTFSTYSSLIDGALNWNAGWPIDITASNYQSEQGTLSNLDGTTTDQQYLSGLSSFGGSYLPTVSPWFFTHYGPHSFQKNVRCHIHFDLKAYSSKT